MTILFFKKISMAVSSKFLLFSFQDQMIFIITRGFLNLIYLNFIKFFVVVVVAGCPLLSNLTGKTGYGMSCLPSSVSIGQSSAHWPTQKITQYKLMETNSRFPLQFSHDILPYTNSSENCIYNSIPNSKNNKAYQHHNHHLNLRNGLEQTSLIITVRCDLVVEIFISLHIIFNRN